MQRGERHLPASAKCKWATLFGVAQDICSGKWNQLSHKSLREAPHVSCCAEVKEFDPNSLTEVT